MQNRIINGQLVIENCEYVVKGNLEVTDSVIIKNGSLVVEGDLLIHSKHCNNINIYNGKVYAKSITTTANIYISNGNVITFRNLKCNNIRCLGGDIIVGGDAHVRSVFCRNYLVDGCNNSDDIEAECTVYIMEFSNSKNITAPEVFLGGGGNFNGNTIKCDYFEFDGHIYSCLRRYFLTKES